MTMEKQISTLILGLMTVLILPSIPNNWIAVIVLLLGIILLKHYTLLASFIIGFSVCVLLINVHFKTLQYILPANSSIKGTIVSLPQQGKIHNRFYFELSSIVIENKLLKTKGKILLSWPGQHELIQGQRWQFDIKAKPITGLFNQGSFNYQRYLISQGIIARGTIKSASPINLAADKRGVLSNKIHQQIHNLTHERFINALILGDKRGFNDKDWQVMRETGTSHLFAISGLHLSLVALLMAVIVKFLLNIMFIRNILFTVTTSLKLTKLIKHKYHFTIIQFIFISCVISGCTFYSFLAGFSNPTLRALTMIIIFSLGILAKQRITFYQLVLFTLFIFGVINPLSFLSQSFWLSLSAVAVVYLMLTTLSNHQSSQVSKLTNLKHKILFLIKLQLGLAFCLCIIQVCFFGGISIIAPAANLIAVPIVTLIILPLTFIATCLMAINLNFMADYIFIMANELLAYLFIFLTWISSSSWDWVDGKWVLYVLLSILIILGYLMCYLFINLKIKVFVILFMLWNMVLIACFTLPKKNNKWLVDFLDVGHGNSTVIRHQGQTIIIDTGNKFGEDSTLAEQVIMPFLKYHHIDNVDYIITTHQDSDHASGLDFLSATFPQARLINNHNGSCNNKEINWNGLIIKMTQIRRGLKKSEYTENNLSCVLRFSNELGSVLFAGDIERAAERILIKKLDHQWQSTVLQVPHHGSNTSSSKPFIELIKPSIAIISTNAFNQWHFPRLNVLNRYRQIQSDIKNTAISGQITIEFSEKGPIITTYRQNRWPFWYNGDLSFGHYRR